MKLMSGLILTLFISFSSAGIDANIDDFLVNKKEVYDNSEKNLEDLRRKNVDILEDQSFLVEFENWGKVRFVSTRNYDDPKFKLDFYLTDADENILYRFPDFFYNIKYTPTAEDVKAVSFKDVNKDGLKDVIIIGDYITGIGKWGVIPYPEAKIYFQKGQDFISSPNLDDELTFSIDRKNGNITKVLEVFNEKDYTYYTANKEYRKNNVIISYPKVFDLKDTQKQNKINRLIKEHALKVANHQYKLDNDTLTEISYYIELKTNDILSITYNITKFKGKDREYMYFTYPTNIDINSGHRLRLKDIIKIDDDFIEKIRNGHFETYKNNPNIDLNKIFNRNILKKLLEADSQENIGVRDESYIFTYLTSDHIYIGLDGTHVGKGYVGLKIKYKDILENIKLEYLAIPQEEFYGEWIVEKNITPNWVPSIYGKEDIEKMIGTKVVYSKEIAMYDNRICKNPFYKKEIVKDKDLIYMYLIFYRNIGIDSEEGTIVKVYKDKQFKETWGGSMGDTFILKDENTLVLRGAGVFLELKRIN